jgi:hypothetical protein
MDINETFDIIDHKKYANVSGNSSLDSFAKFARIIEYPFTDIDQIKFDCNGKPLFALEIKKLNEYPCDPDNISLMDFMLKE